ncbi:hypothetical protein QJS10_CPB14g00652 [Acorus calamus]|uniref:Transmembrane protein n=1 Tax=Acorus calamus TaxID=4465 RepID=A0AAV9DES3_ACOCL|nr:hypothetical protein QJS10_CPB14g00652 [Acorus calamus]
MATTSPSLALYGSLQICRPSLPISSLGVSIDKRRPKKQSFYPLFTLEGTARERSRLWRASAANEDVLASNGPIEETHKIVSTNGDATSTIISVLLTIAFVGLTILTVGKREKEKFEKEEAAQKKKKSGKKVKVRARSGPRGFGQKVEADDD